MFWGDFKVATDPYAPMDSKAVEVLLAKLDSTMSTGQLIKIKATAQGLAEAENRTDADEVYDTV